MERKREREREWGMDIMRGVDSGSDKKRVKVRKERRGERRE